MGRLSPGFGFAAALLLLAGPLSARPTHRPVRTRPAGPPTAEALFVRVLRSDGFAYKGRQVTTDWRTGAAVDVEVFHAPSDRQRLQYLNPESRRGRLLVSDGHQEWQFDPHTRTLRHRRLSPGALDDDDYLLSYTLLRANYVLAVDPRPRVWADRRCYLVSVKRPGRLTLARRFWVDAGSGLILKRENYGQGGRLAVTVAFADIAYHPRLTPALFDLGGMARTPGVRKTELPSPWEARVALGAVRGQLGGLASAPPFLAGYRLVGATRTAVRGRPLLHLRYSDGLNLVSLFEQRRAQTRRPTAVAGRPLLLGSVPAHVLRRGALLSLNWDTPALNITLMGEGGLGTLRVLALAAAR